jgi:DNA-binding CsgD family transcriptional regulator
MDEPDGARRMNEGLPALSEREKETLRLLLGGYDIKSVAADMGLSVNTVNERLRDARRKLGASSRRQAARMLADAEQDGHRFSAEFLDQPNFSADRKSGWRGVPPQRQIISIQVERRVEDIPSPGLLEECSSCP